VSVVEWLSPRDDVPDCNLTLSGQRLAQERDGSEGGRLVEERTPLLVDSFNRGAWNGAREIDCNERKRSEEGENSDREE